MDRGERGARLACCAVAYAVVVFGVVALANLGWLPGTGEAHEGLFDHPYRLTLAVLTLLLAASLGAWAGALGALRGSRLHGLSALFIGGVLTGVALGMAPWILFPHDRYSPAFMWPVGGAPIGVVSWAAFSFGSKMGENRGVTLPT